MNHDGRDSGSAGLLDVAVAMKKVLAGALPLDAETVPLGEAGGRFTAVPYESPVDLPGFDNSAMDGFALISADTADGTRSSPPELRIVGESRAGSPWSGTLERGQALRISTGAAVPAGADAVLRKEDATLDGETLRVDSATEPGRNIRCRGEVMVAGTEVLGSGTGLGPVELGILATIGRGEVTCHRRPQVALLTTGDELVEPGGSLAPGQIFNSNSVVVASLIEGAGAELDTVECVPDDRTAMVDALGRSLAADLTVICGGVSVGEHDQVKPALSELGVDQDFWGLALKPGRPAWSGRRGDSRVLGLPGNPVSVLVVFNLLGVPLLRTLGGGPLPEPAFARLSAPVSRLSDRVHMIPCHLEGAGAERVLTPLPQRGSHDFQALGDADCLAAVPAGTGRAEAGEVLETLALR